MTTLLTPYEEYYQSTGLVEYERVFEFNTELDTEVAIYAHYMKDWAGLRLREMRVLDIGCGLGTFTQKLLRTLFHADDCNRSQEPKVTFDLVDINPGSFDHFASRLAERGEYSVTLERKICLPWQDISPSQLAAGYDLVVANHCFYGCRCDEALIRSVTRLLNPGGLALFALASKHSDIYQMRQEVDIQINTGEDLERGLLNVSCNYTRAAYESKFNFDLNQPMFLNWLFASSTVDAEAQQRLLKKYAHLSDRESYIINRALIHIVEAQTLPEAPL